MMLKISDKLKNFGAMLATVESNCYHYFHLVENAPYIIWAETGEADSFHSGNHKTEQVIDIAVDYYTKTEFDKAIDDLQSLFDANEWRWSLDLVAYEDETNLIHYSWGVRIGNI